MVSVAVGNDVVTLVRKNRVMWQVLVNGEVIHEVRGRENARQAANDLVKELNAALKYIPAPGRISRNAAKVIAGTIEYALDEAGWKNLPDKERKALIEEHRADLVQRAAYAGTLHQLNEMLKGQSIPITKHLGVEKPEKFLMPKRWRGFFIRAMKYAERTLSNPERINRAWTS